MDLDHWPRYCSCCTSIVAFTVCPQHYPVKLDRHRFSHIPIFFYLTLRNHVLTCWHTGRLTRMMLKNTNVLSLRRGCCCLLVCKGASYVFLLPTTPMPRHVNSCSCLPARCASNARASTNENLGADICCAEIVQQPAQHHVGAGSPGRSFWERLQFRGRRPGTVTPTSSCRSYWPDRSVAYALHTPSKSMYELPATLAIVLGTQWHVVATFNPTQSVICSTVHIDKNSITLYISCPACGPSLTLTCCPTGEGIDIHEAGSHTQLGAECYLSHCRRMGEPWAPAAVAVHASVDGRSFHPAGLFSAGLTQTLKMGSPANMRHLQFPA